MFNYIIMDTGKILIYNFFNIKIFIQIPIKDEMIDGISEDLCKILNLEKYE